MHNMLALGLIEGGKTYICICLYISYTCNILEKMYKKLLTVAACEEEWQVGGSRAGKRFTVYPFLFLKFLNGECISNYNISDSNKTK